MTKKIIIFCLLFQVTNITRAQVNIKLTSESIYNYVNPKISNNRKDTMKPIGKIGNSILFYFKNSDSKNIKFYVLNEEKFSFNEVYQDLNLKGRQYFISSSSDSLILYSQSFFENDEDDGFSRLFIQNGQTLFYLDSIVYADKSIHSSFSMDGKWAIVNTLNDLPDYFYPSQDNGFFIYSIDSLKKGAIKRKFIDCLYCSDGFLINNNLFFTKSNQRDDFSNGYSWKDIYYAPFEKLKDSVKIAAYSTILSVSPDGKFILAERLFDLPNGALAIIDVENKKYQLLLGRDYLKGSSFYSFKKKKFAFDYGNKIVYVDFPDEYPFDALQRKNAEIPAWGDPIYQKLKHDIE